MDIHLKFMPGHAGKQMGKYAGQPAREPVPSISPYPEAAENIYFATHDVAYVHQV